MRDDGGKLQPLGSAFCVGEWLAEPRWNRLRRGDAEVRLEPRVMRLLATLAATPGRPLTRQELLDSVWPDVIVNEEALSRAISQLRRALGDDSRRPTFVQTVHKGGYCLVAKVGEPAAAQPLDARAQAAAPTVGPRPAYLLLAAMLVLVAAFALYVLLPRPQPLQPPRMLTPITSDPGREIDPAVSPDGRRVAYLASGEAGYDLFVRDVEGGSAVRLTDDRSAKGHPAWSPDSRRIAFVGSSGERAAIFVTAASGGAIAKLIDLPSWSFGLDWSPDGRTIAYADSAPGKPPAIVLFDIASKAARPLALASGSAGDIKPAFSPDGKRVAFIRNDISERQQIAIVAIGSPGIPTLVTPASRQLRGFDWTPDGESIVYSSRSGHRFGLWRTSADGRSGPQPIRADGGELFNPSIARTGRVVVEDVQQDRDIWQAPLDAGPPAPLVRSTFDDYDVAFAPTGGPMAFVSERSGASAVWVAAPGGQPRQILSVSDAQISHVSWARDASSLTYLADHGSHAALYSQRLAGGSPERLMRADRGQVPLGWSADGKTLMLIAPSGRDWRIECFTRADGTKRLATAPALLLAALAADGRSIFGLAVDGDKVLQIGLDGAVIRQFRLPGSLKSLAALLPARRSLYLLQDPRGGTSVYRLDVASAAVERVTAIEFFDGGTPAIAPDGKSIAFTRTRETANDLAWIQL